MPPGRLVSVEAFMWWQFYVQKCLAGNFGWVKGGCRGTERMQRNYCSVSYQTDKN